VKHLLYSTNVYLKHWVQEKYWDGTHYVWCSEHFDNPPGLHLPPSANPANIYKRLKDDIAGRDTHSEKIAQQKASLVELATRWSDNGQIKPTDCEEILFKVETAAWEDWKPLIYVIPRALLEARMKPVPIAKRASSQANEYIISDLHRNEFEVIEL
jgi:hypothetical protein